MARRREHFTNFPGKDGRLLPLALDDGGDDPWCEQPRSASSNGPRLQEPRAAVAVQDFADAAVGHLRGAAISLDFRFFLCIYVLYQCLMLIVGMLYEFPVTISLQK